MIYYTILYSSYYAMLIFTLHAVDFVHMLCSILQAKMFCLSFVGLLKNNSVRGFGGLAHVSSRPMAENSQLEIQLLRLLSARTVYGAQL